MRIIIYVLSVLVMGLMMMPMSVQAEDLSGNEAAIMDMFGNFAELETDFRNNEWDNAQKTVYKVQRDYSQMVKSLKGHVDEKLLKDFATRLREFKTQMRQKDADVLEDAYMNIQDLFIDIMEELDYPSPPVLIIIDLYVDESSEYLEKGEVHQVAEEMEEIEYHMKRALEEAKNRKLDTGKLEQLLEICEEVARMCESGKSNAKIDNKLQKMASIMKHYVN